MNRFVTGLILVLLQILPYVATAQGYFTIGGPTFTHLSSDVSGNGLDGRNFGFWLEFGGDEFNNTFLTLGSDALLPAVRGLKLNAQNPEQNQGLLSGGYVTNDVSLFTWRQGVMGEGEILDHDMGIIAGFSTDWRHISRPVQGKYNENFYSIGLMGGLFAHGDMLEDLGIKNEMTSKYGEELTFALKLGLEAVVDERGSHNIWLEGLIGIPLKDEIGMAVAPYFASRKLLAWNFTNGHEHERFNSLGVRVLFYIYAD